MKTKLTLLFSFLLVFSIGCQQSGNDGKINENKPNMEDSNDQPILNRESACISDEFTSTDVISVFDSFKMRSEIINVNCNGSSTGQCPSQEKYVAILAALLLEAIELETSHGRILTESPVIFLRIFDAFFSIEDLSIRNLNQTRLDRMMECDTEQNRRNI